MARAIVYTAFGGPEVLHLVDVPDPIPGEGELAVRVEAAGVNPIDWKLRSGLRPSAAIAEPRRVGSDAAGVITAVGAGVDGFAVGDPVVLKGVSGAYATDVVVAAANAWIRPPQVTAVEGAALGVPVGTAYQTARSLGVGAGDTLLRARRIRRGRTGDHPVRRPLGCDRPGDRVTCPVRPRAGPGSRSRSRTDRGWPTACARCAPGGVNVAIDAAGTDEALQTSVELVADTARIATAGSRPGRSGLRHPRLQRWQPRAPDRQQNAWRTEAIPVTLALLAAGSFSVEPGPTFPLADAAEAHRTGQAGARGKIVLLP